MKKRGILFKLFQGKTIFRKAGEKPEPRTQRSIEANENLSEYGKENKIKVKALGAFLISTFFLRNFSQKLPASVLR